MPRTIQNVESLGVLWGDLVYLKARLLRDSRTKPLAPQVDEWIHKTEAMMLAQRSKRRNEVEAQSAVDEINYHMDETTLEFSEQKIRVLRRENPGWREQDARDSPFFRLYFKVAPSVHVKKALESQLKDTQHYPDLLARETDPELQAFQKRFEAHLEDGYAALKARSQAQTETAAHRANELNALFEGANNFRATTHRTLAEMAQSLRLPKAWAEEFFRKLEGGGPDKAELRGRTQTILGVLAARKIEVSEEARAKIQQNTDLALFELWTSRVAWVDSTEALFAEDPSRSPTSTSRARRPR